MSWLLIISRSSMIFFQSSHLLFHAILKSPCSQLRVATSRREIFFSAVVFISIICPGPRSFASFSQRLRDFTLMLQWAATSFWNTSVHHLATSNTFLHHQGAIGLHLVWAPGHLITTITSKEATPANIAGLEVEEWRNLHLDLRIHCHQPKPRHRGANDLEH